MGIFFLNCMLFIFPYLYYLTLPSEKLILFHWYIRILKNNIINNILKLPRYSSLHYFDLCQYSG